MSFPRRQARPWGCFFPLASADNRIALIVCPACFGPLEARYDLDVVAQTLQRDTIARRAPGIWRYPAIAGG